MHKGICEIKNNKFVKGIYRGKIPKSYFDNISPNESIFVIHLFTKKWLISGAIPFRGNSKGF